MLTTFLFDVIRTPQFEISTYNRFAKSDTKWRASPEMYSPDPLQRGWRPLLGCSSLLIGAAWAALSGQQPKRQSRVATPRPLGADDAVIECGDRLEERELQPTLRLEALHACRPVAPAIFQSRTRRSEVLFVRGFSRSSS